MTDYSVLESKYAIQSLLKGDSLVIKLKKIYLHMSSIKKFKYKNK